MKNQILKLTVFCFLIISFGCNTETDKIYPAGNLDLALDEQGRVAMLTDHSTGTD